MFLALCLLIVMRVNAIKVINPFYHSTLNSRAPLEIVYTDLWTSLVHSLDGFKYYVIFVDHFTKYIWFYPLKNKSDTKSVFIRFKSLVEKYFEKTIKILYSDNGGGSMKH